MANYSILIIEDNAAIRKLFRVALQVENYSVLEAEDAGSALQICRQNKPDLILQDIILPDMDGFELNRRLREMPHIAEIPILAVSGFLNRIEETKIMKSGFTAFLLKPVEIARLIEAVRLYLPSTTTTTSKNIGQGKYILIADDNAMQRKLLELQLTYAGFAVKAVTNGKEALQSIHIKKPDAVISDILMPQVDGFELCLAIRRDPMLKSIPVILVTSHYLDDMDYTLGKKVGANFYLQRTPDNEELIEKLVNCFNIKESLAVLDSTSLLKEEHTHQLIRQLENQLFINTGFSQQCALQSAQIALLNSVADTLIHNSNIESALQQVLNTCLDAAGIPRAALYLFQKNKFILQQAIGYLDSEKKIIENFFGCPQFFLEIKTEKKLIAIPPVANSNNEEFLKKADVNSALIIPLLLSEKLLGVLFLGSKTVDITDDDTLIFSQSLAFQIAQAIALAAAFEQINQSNIKLEKIVKERTHQLEITNKELEAFSYSVSHDLRAPLRSIDGFNQLLLQKHSDNLAGEAKEYLQHIHKNVEQMKQLIDGLLILSRITRSELIRQAVNLSDEVNSICNELIARDPHRQVELIITPNIIANGDPKLLHIMLENLLNNAWKFTSKQSFAQIEFGVASFPDNKKAFYVRDNGVGFDMENSNKLFVAFQRLPSAENFPGNGIGLATVARIIHRHGGVIWAKSAINQGATFYFVL